MSLVKRDDSDSEEIVDLGNSEYEYQEERKEKTLWGKIKVPLYIVSILSILAVFAFSIFNSSKTILVDNPTGSGILVKINNSTEYNIPAYSNVKADIKSGKNEVFLNGEKVGEFERKITDFGVFLNPTLDIYVSEFILYTDSDDDSYYENLPNNKLEIYGNELEGPFEKHNSLYMKGSWDYGIDQEEPDEVTLGRTQNYKIIEKLYRFEDFVNMYNSEYIIEE